MEGNHVMTRRWCVIACCVLLSTAPIFAQARSKAVDPISGTWTGEFVLENGFRHVPVTMALKFDGKSAVSGTVSGLPNPAEVKIGIFDPKTGALKLQLGKKGDSAVLLILEGTVVKGTAAGRISGDGAGDFKIAKKAHA